MPETLIAAVPESALSRANPFPGLRPYGEEDANWFFGRSGEINELLKRLRRVHFVAVVGASGSGKSSLVRAGVLPQIRDGYLDADWRIAQFRPGERPIANLAEALGLKVGGDPGDPDNPLRRGPKGLVRALEAAELAGERTRVLILVDQFEELFQFAQRTGDSAQEEIKEFLKLLLTAAGSDDVSVYVVVTMRLEWLNECAAYAGLAEAINEGLYLVPQMRRQQFMQAILGPLEAADGSVTSALLDRMLNDLDNKSDQLPVLQHALLRLWEREGAREPFDTAGYEAVGTFSNCLSAHAEEVYADLTEREKQVAELLFRSITQVNKDRKTRRPRPVGEILLSTGVQFGELEAVISAFSRAGRSFLVTTEGALTQASIVDLSHEALIRQWVRLSKWVENEAEVRARIERLDEDAAEWVRDPPKMKACLYTGSRLVRAEELQSHLDPGSTAVAFVKESVRARFWQLMRKRGWIGLAALLLVGVALALAFVSSEQAKARTTLALANQRKAESEAAVASHQAENAQRYVTDVKQQIDAAKGSATALAAIAADIQAERVYVQYAPGAAATAKTVQAMLQKQRFAVPGIEQVSPDHAPIQTQVRFFHSEDRGDAYKLAGLVKGVVSGGISVQATANPQGIVPPGQFEVWVIAGPTATTTATSNNVANNNGGAGTTTAVVDSHVKTDDTAVDSGTKVIQGPSLTASIYPDRLWPGRAATLSWKTENASQVQVEGIGDVAANGSMQVTPAQSTTYKFIAKGNGQTVTSSVSAEVTGAAPAPVPLANAEVSGVMSALSLYKEAYESESLEEVQRAWPTVSKAQQKNFESVFKQFNAIRVSLSCREEDIHVEGAAATATCRQTAVYTQKGKRQPEQATSTTFRLRKVGPRWVVDAVQ